MSSFRFVQMAMHKRKTIDLEQGWEFMQKGITKLKNILEGLPEPQFNSEEYMMLYTTIYNMCTQKPPHDYSQQLYDKCKESFEEYISFTVLPSLKDKHGEFMLRELVKRWLNHKIMVRLLSGFFNYLDRHFIARKSLPTINEVGLTCFRDSVYNEIKVEVRDAVISLIDQEREGEQIDRALLKNVLDIFVEIGHSSMECYENDFEAAMLENTAAYYSRKASKWILEDSCLEYMLKAEECLKREKDRVSHYLHSSSEPKILEKLSCLPCPCAPLRGHFSLLQTTSQETKRERAVTVYGPSYSTATARVIACLEVYGVEYRQVPVDLAAAEHNQQAVLYGNTFGQVPAFEDGDLKLFESRVITRYIAKKYNGNGPDLLREGNLEESTMVNIWMEVEAHQLDKAVQPIILQLLVVPVLLGGIPDQQIVEESVKNVEKLLDMYETRLSASKYLAGDFFSLADLNHLPYLYYLITTPYASVITSRPHLKAWWEDLLLRPACQKVTAKMKW